MIYYKVFAHGVPINNSQKFKKLTNENQCPPFVQDSTHKVYYRLVHETLDSNLRVQDRSVRFCIRRTQNRETLKELDQYVKLRRDL